MAVRLGFKARRALPLPALKPAAWLCTKSHKQPSVDNADLVPSSRAAHRHGGIVFKSCPTPKPKLGDLSLCGGCRATAPAVATPNRQRRRA